MCIRMTNSCFVHIPRTGGLWLGRILDIINLKHQTLRGDIDSHFSYKQLPDNWKELKSFTFIRHPLDWVRSRWSHAREINALQDYRHYGIHREFDECIKPTLEETIIKILQDNPGLVTKTYKYMSDGINFVFKTENIVTRTIEMLKKYEKIKDYQIDLITKNSSKYNSTYHLYETSTLSNKILYRFMISENEAYNMWKRAK